MKNRPLVFNAFLFSILCFIPISIVITIFQDISFLVNEDASVIFKVTAYSKTAIKFFIGTYAVATAFFLIKKMKTAYIHSILLSIVVLATPFLIEIPYFLLEWWVKSPPYVIKEVIKFFPFSLAFFLIFFPYLLFSKWVRSEYKDKNLHNQTLNIDRGNSPASS